MYCEFKFKTLLIFLGDEQKRFQFFSLKKIRQKKVVGATSLPRLELERIKYKHLSKK